MNIGKFSVSNPVLLNIVWVAFLLLGAFSFTRIPRELFSDISFSWAYVVVPYPGVGAQEIEKNITIKLEDELADLQKVKKISSHSREGSSMVMVEFEDDISRREFERLYQDFRAEIDKVDLPDDALDPIVDEFSSGDFAPVITVILTADSSVSDARMNTIGRELRDKIQDVDKVSGVTLVGGREREVWIEANQQKLEAFNVSLQSVADVIRFRNLNIPGGTADIGNREYMLETVGEVARADEFGAVIVRRTPGQGSVKVNDVANVNRGLAVAEFDVRYNGQRAIKLEVAKRTEGNSIKIVDEIQRVIGEYQKQMPAGTKVHYFGDTTLQIREILSILGSNAISGFILLVAILFVFMGLRNALLTALSIPLTFAITFIFMEWYGESLNGNSLFGLVLVLGMIVDHAIVIMENSHRHRQMGRSAKDAAIVGTNEVVLPVLAGTLTTVAAFLPLMVLPGLLGKFMRIIPIVVSLALVISTIEALVFLPVHFADWGGKVKENAGGLIERFIKRFGLFVGRIYKHKYLTTSLTVLLIIITAFLVPFIKKDLFAGESLTYFFIDIELPTGTSRAITDRVTSRFEQRLLPLVGKGEITSINTTVGYVLTDEDRIERNNVAQIVVDVAERTEGRNKPIGQIMRETETLLEDIAGAEKISFRTVNNGPPVDKPVSFRIQGENLDDMKAVADEYTRFLSQYPILYNITDNFVPGLPQLRVVVNEERAAELGLNAALIGSYLRGAFDGIKATTYFDNDEEIDVIVKFSEQDRSSMNNILSMKFPTMDGRLIPFSTVCRLERSQGISGIRRVDRSREITVTADASDKAGVATILDAVQKRFDTQYKVSFPGVTLKMGGEFAEFGKLLGDILRLFWIGLFLIYVILGAQFKSYLQPLIMIFSIPFAIMGSLLFLVTSGTPISTVVLYAGVALTGISVNDSIVLISFINALRRGGKTTAEAVVEACQVRLRPIILTSVTTIGGLLPMALGIGGKSEVWAPMASTIIFGLFFSTVGTLLVIPCIYGILDDIMARFGIKMKLEGD